MKTKTLTRGDVTVQNTRLRGFRGTAWLVEVDGRYFAVSAVVDEDIDGDMVSETSVFETNRTASLVVDDEFVSISDFDHEEAIDALLMVLNKEREIDSLRKEISTDLWNVLTDVRYNRFPQDAEIEDYIEALLSEFNITRK